MEVRAHRSLLALLAIAVLLALPRLALSAPSVAGAWRLDSYLLDGKDVPVSGTLIFTEDHFGMVYRMGASGDSGRGHGGTYRVEENQIHFRFRSGCSSSMARLGRWPRPPRPRAVSRSRATSSRLRFENEAVQRFTRAPMAASPRRRLEYGRL
jgi:hypothetical protein